MRSGQEGTTFALHIAWEGVVISHTQALTLVMCGIKIVRNCDLALMLSIKCVFVKQSNKCLTRSRGGRNLEPGSARADIFNYNLEVRSRSLRRSNGMCD